MQGKANIGTLTGSDLQWVLTRFDREVILWFWDCLYAPEEIANRFENNALLLKKRAIQMKFLNVICDATGYSQNYFIAHIKTRLPQFYPTLPTLAAFKINVETGKFTGVSQGAILNAIDDFINYLYPWRWIVDFTSIDYKTGCPDFANDFTSIIINSNVDPNSTDPFNYNPVPVVTPATTPVVTPGTTPGTSNASMMSIALPLAIGGAVLYGMFSKKKKK